MLKVHKKWRPSLKLAVVLVVTTLVALPLIGLMAARLTSNQFVRETENMLVSQAVLLSEIYAGLYRAYAEPPYEGRFLSESQIRERKNSYSPWTPELNAGRENILGPRPDPRPAKAFPAPVYSHIGPLLTQLTRQVQKTTLAGYLALDANGQIIAASGRNVDGGSLAHIQEVRRALSGEISTTLRFRTEKADRHPLASISRDTSFRVFVAAPVIVNNRVVGAVYLSRTPNNLRKFIIQERDTIAVVSISVLVAATLVGFLLWRLISRPIAMLRQQSQKVVYGDSELPAPINHYGTREVAELGQSILSMAGSLRQKTEGLQAYTAHVTHELKSPLTAIAGAVELLEQSGEKMAPETRAKFLRNIAKDSDRMSKLLDSLRLLAATKLARERRSAPLSPLVAKLKDEFSGLSLSCNSQTGGEVPLPEADLRVLLTQLLQNAAQHGAKKVDISFSNNQLRFSDNGPGISPSNAGKIFDPFFTTNRDKGGTGMGLAIVKSLLETHGATISVDSSKDGATFNIQFG